MKILAHPLKSGEFISYVLDHTGRPISAEIRKTAQDIIVAASEMAKKYNVTSSLYVDDFSCTSKKPKWKINHI